jgi:hypothetical protein
VQEWNVIVNLSERVRRYTCRKLEIFGATGETGFFNVLLMKVDDLPGMLETMRRWIQEDPESLSFLPRVIPAARTIGR